MVSSICTKWDGAAVRVLTSHQCGLGLILAFYHMWVEFVVGSDLATKTVHKGLFYGFSGFPPHLEHLRYHGRWIDSVWKSRSYAGALKENPINLYIF